MTPADRDLVIALCRLILADLTRRPAVEPLRPTDPTYASLERRVVDLERAAPKAPPPPRAGVAPRFYTVRDVTAMLGLTRTTLWRWEREGLLPKRCRLTDGGRQRWHAAEIDAWIANKGVTREVEPAARRRPKR